MDYYELRFKITPVSEEARDIVADIAGQAGCESFIETGDGINGYAQVDMLDKQQLEQELSDFIIPGVDIEYSIEEVEKENWNKTWESNGFEPITVDGKCLIYDAKNSDIDTIPNHEQYPVTVAIDTEMSFGTGNHETTRMIVSALLSSDIVGKRVLDCGCGTGILSIVAAKCGASDIVAYDIDEWSVNNTRHNAEINSVNNIEVLLGNSNVLSHISGMFDIVMANINRNVLLEDMAKFREVMASYGTLILSGFYEYDVDILVKEAESLGLTCDKIREDGDWRCIIFTS
ncbi:MAG: 50S ribosomal protein L11 methyltransferase [Prevotella sp.]|nr:50S ribosomal protein L11 methyltransferase [Prevotella sp.]